MRHSISAHYFMSFSLAAAAISGCSSGSSTGTSIPQNTVKVSSLLAKAAVRNMPHAGRRHWVNPTCCNAGRIIYVSDSANNEVFGYVFRTGASLGFVVAPPEGFNQPQGECVQSSTQHVFIANTLEKTVDEYSYSGSYLATISDPGGFPVSCSVDPATNNLAVGNVTDFTSGPNTGSVSVFNSSLVFQNTYPDPTFYGLSFVSYGSASVLFVDGTTSAAGGFLFAEMSPAGLFTPITLASTPPCPCTINTAGDVEFIPGPAYVAIGDQAPGATNPVRNIYHVLPNGTVTGITTLAPAPSDLMQFAVTASGSKITAADSGTGHADIRTYPAGNLVRAIINGGTPVGAAIVHH